MRKDTHAYLNQGWTPGCSRDAAVRLFSFIAEGRIVWIGIARVCVIPLLVFLYAAPLPFLAMRNAMHRMLHFLDWAFDKVAASVGWNTQFWELPKSQEAPLPYSEDWW